MEKWWVWGWENGEYGYGEVTDILYIYTRYPENYTCFICIMDHDEDMQALLDLLEEAVILASQYSGGYSEGFMSAEQFHTTLAASVDRLKAGDYTELDQLYIWFAPAGAWDDLVGHVALGHIIFEKAGDLQHRLLNNS